MGLYFYTNINERGDTTYKTASVDRIDSSKGYIADNIQILHKDINVMKWDFTQDYFLHLCYLIYNNMKAKYDL